MHSIRKSFLELLFSGALLSRWNDKLRPSSLMEIDKQAHKMIVAWILLELNGEEFKEEERVDLEKMLIEHTLFDYLYRLIITDIKPPVFYKIKENAEDFAALTKWVLSQLENLVRPFDENFWQRLVNYHKNTDDSDKNSLLCKNILEAAHLYASGWECNTIKALNHFDEEFPSIEASFITRLNELAHIKGVSDLLADGTFAKLNKVEFEKQKKSQDLFDSNIFLPFSGKKSSLGLFAKLCGQLRFQIRWSGAPRIPETSVLGHMFFVGTLAYCFSLSLGACQARCNNNFFTGLFHDLPELLTRDIISPVKKSTDQVGNLIKKYEEEVLDSRIFTPLIKAGYGKAVERLHYYLGLIGNCESEFMQTSLKDGELVCYKDWDELHEKANTNGMNAKDGFLVKACDNLAAYIEAHASVRNGIGTTQFIEAMTRLRETERKRTNLGAINFASLFADFG